MGDVITFVVAGAGFALKQTDWILQDEEAAAVVTLPQRRAAREGNGIAALIDHAGRLVAGVQI